MQFNIISVLFTSCWKVFRKEIFKIAELSIHFGQHMNNEPEQFGSVDPGIHEPDAPHIYHWCGLTPRGTV